MAHQKVLEKTVGPMIKVENLVKKYHGEIVAVDGISFEVERGQILGFLGPNGAGKTTTMRVISGYMPATSGTVIVDGFDIFTHSREARRRIGYLPEHPPLYKEMTAIEYLQFVAKINGVARKQIPDRIDYVVSNCGLEEITHRLIGQISKGFQQRMGLAQALIHDPEILILDEPTIGLDPRQIREIRDLIRSLGGDRTIVLSTHILPEVTMTCDRAVIIHRGRIVADDTLENLAKTGFEDERIYIRLTGSDASVIPRLKALKGVIDVQEGDHKEAFVITVDPQADVGPDISLEILNQGWGLAELSRPSASLEEVFVRLTAQ